MTARRDELASALDAVRSRIADAARSAGRDEREIELVVVTKRFPSSDVDLLAELGVTHVGENKDQEASAKVAEIERRDALTVHFVGQLQSNKAAHVASYADVVQSLDRAKLVGALDRAAQRHDRTLDVLVQVGLDEVGGDDRGAGVAGRGGAVPSDARALADLVASSQALRLRGVMGVAPRQGDPRRAFARLREVADGIRADHPDATWLSAGMSGDLEAAVAEGATHLRVGTAILGTRLSLG